MSESSKWFSTLLALAACLSPNAGADVGAVDELVTLASRQGGLGSHLAANDNFGSSVADLGDLDGDGVHEVAVGAIGDTSFAGAVDVLFRNADGTVRAVQRIGVGAGGFQGVLADNDLFGYALAGLGDLDGDGVPDLAVGSIGGDDGSFEVGAVWILFLNANGTVKAHLKLTAGAGGFGGTLDTFDLFGSSLAALGDLNGDGTLELAVGAMGDDDGVADAGALWIVSLGPAGATTEQKISMASGGFGGVLDSFGRFGNSVCALGDVDGDGVTDLAVGASLADSSDGQVWILFLKADGSVRTEQALSGATVGIPDLIESGDRFGSGVAPLGDLDGDGVVDLAVGAPRKDGIVPDVGAIALLYLTTTGTVGSARILSDAEPLLAPQLGLSEEFGLALGRVEDATWPWLLVGAPQRGTSALPKAGATESLRLRTSDPVAAFRVDQTLGAAPLTVAFSDLSTGTALASWEWEFGDGGASTAQSPGYTYATPGTYTVSLRVTGGGAGSRETKPNLVRVVAAASVSARNGSGVNPDVLRERTLPVLGMTWQAEVDGTGFGGSGLTFLVGYEGQLAGVPTVFGELLIDVTAPFVLVDFGLFVSGVALHDASVPNDLALAGFPFSLQALVNSPGQLTNALDVVLGL